ncbi:hypothetical protein EBL_c05200 [Shimwellia blattae DSM 4481 = NBRC 105725]|uniref:Uncharacterized protein n=1 Tax=Shimwellia blattae (strain ATCC 29907 / DSM 4481 / JCM 1650 / NBRC 105725 / CDC 9005-74) TaxID=630626 RepID=I2B542_SHIBC|nr:hypothetical protein EBL_c05200 [Shimwellia blattae DSM 4481 = NBRC 105725]
MPGSALQTHPLVKGSGTGRPVVMSFQ